MQGPPAPRPAILGTSPTLDKAPIHNVLLTIGCNSALHCHRQMAYSSHRIPTTLDQILAPPPPAKRSMIRPQGMAHLSSIHYLPMLHLENWQRGCLRPDTFLDFSYPVLQHHCNVSKQLPYLCLTYGQDPKTTCRTLSGRIRYCSCSDCFSKEANSQQKKIPQRNTFPAIDRVL